MSEFVTRKRKLSLSRITGHEFGRALRVLRRTMSPDAILRALVAERTKSLTNGMRAFALAIIVALWLSSGKQILAINVFLIDISVASAYVNIFLSYLAMGSFTSFKNYFTLNEFIQIASNRLFKHNSSWVITILEDGSNAWSIDLVRQYRFLSSGSAHSVLSIFAFLLIFLPFLGIYIFIYYMLIEVGISAINSAGWMSLDALFTYAGWSFAFYPILHTVLTAIPFSFTKNTDYIRWNFLYPIHKRDNFFPKNMDR